MIKSLLIGCLIFFVAIFSGCKCYSQNLNEWMWIHGDNTASGNGNMGTKGVPALSNEPPSAYEAIEWTDLNGNFWMYGGYHGSGNEDNLWKYNPLTNEWTWIAGANVINDVGAYGSQGVPSPGNQPPSRSWGACSWVDKNGNFWMFGGLNNGPYNDLWMYNVLTNEWTWMKGPNITGVLGTYGLKGVPDPTNNPGSRTEISAAWTDDNGDLWLFGGYDWGNSGGVFNDMWRYNIATNTWTWMKGSNSPTVWTAVYGTQTVEDSLNTPGGRFAYGRWKDNNGNLWLFGGADYPNSQYMSDLWRFNPTTNNWTWMKGSQFANTAGVYGTKFISSPTNLPGPRMENRAAWKDNQGNFWLFGGYYNGVQWNDLWKYNLSTNEWTWESGDTFGGPAGNWGTINVSNPLNKPNGRMGSVGWIDNSCHIYFFGGYNPAGITYNDMWKYTIDTACAITSLPQALFISSDTAFCSEPANCINFIDQSTNNPTSWQWTFSGAVPDTSTQQNPTNICYYSPGTFSVTLIVTNAGGTDTLTVSPMITVGNAPSPPTVTLAGDTLFSSHGAVYQWYFNGSPIGGATDSFYVATQNGTYAVLIADSIGCSSLSSGVMWTSVDEFGVRSLELKIYPNPGNGVINISMGKAITGEVNVFDVLGKNVYSETFSGKQKTIDTKLNKGVYFLRVSDEEGGWIRKVIIQ